MRRFPASVAVLFLSLNFTAVCFADGPKMFQSGPGRTALVELFTSEGCSSCPPADQWMSGLKDSPYLWKKIVPVAFHVDYWNNLGWTDPVSRPEFTERQRAYASRWKSASVYTPMIVTGGSESKDWYLSPTIQIKNEKDAGILKINEKSPGEFEILYYPHNGTFVRRAVVSAAYLGSGIVSRVERGENGGKTLRHDFTALLFQNRKMDYKEGVLTAEVRFDLSQAPAAPHHAIAVWVTRPSKSEPLQAGGGELD